MARKLHDGTVLRTCFLSGFKKGPPLDFMLEAISCLANGRKPDPCVFGTTSNGYREYPIRFTWIAVVDKGLFLIEGVFDYSRAGRPPGSRPIDNKRIALQYNSHSRISTGIFVEDDIAL